MPSCGGETTTPDPKETQFTVTFDVDGGSTVALLKVNKDAKVTKPESDPTKDGHTFDNWYKDSGKTTAFNFTTETITEDITIYAKWNVIRNITIELKHTGLHEVIASVTSDTNFEAGFVISKSATAPIYNTVKTLKSFYTRNLVVNEAKLMYFSVTDKTSNEFSSLSTKSGTASLNNEEQYLKEETMYHIYVYDNQGGNMTHRSSFTTVPFPTITTSTPANHPFELEGSLEQYTIEMKSEEIFFVPARIIKDTNVSMIMIINVGSVGVLICSRRDGVFCTPEVRLIKGFVQEHANVSERMMDVLLYCTSNLFDETEKNIYYGWGTNVQKLFNVKLISE